MKKLQINNEECKPLSESAEKMVTGQWNVEAFGSMRALLTENVSRTRILPMLDTTFSSSRICRCRCRGSHERDESLTSPTSITKRSPWPTFRTFYSTTEIPPVSRKWVAKAQLRKSGELSSSRNVSASHRRRPAAAMATKLVVISQLVA